MKIDGDEIAAQLERLHKAFPNEEEQSISCDLAEGTFRFVASIRPKYNNPYGFEFQCAFGESPTQAADNLCAKVNVNGRDPRVCLAGKMAELQSQLDELNKLANPEPATV